MLSNEKINRINYLSKKSKSSGLTDEEKREQQDLRKEYIQSFRNSMENTLHSVKVVDKEGNDVTPTKLKKSKNSRFH
ncbi:MULTISPECIES: DUF896 domain-containing protein [Bacillaceae]|uniref:DUF896 domain-containing protein n=1 Tax=Bacillaceae TaxID=186817 RepID=UPI001BDF6865|nr:MULTISPECIES: DUF896 domain-containing protein [unclassified Cytobacillus]MDX8360188.1 DUF896 domain-containing protein [Cytobacillus sp. IB215316]MDX8366980.1 DUF896 domain-containing protein [Cytobacillus sp. IB215665]